MVRLRSQRGLQPALSWAEAEAEAVIVGRTLLPVKLHAGSGGHSDRVAGRSAGMPTCARLRGALRDGDAGPENGRWERRSICAGTGDDVRRQLR